MTDNLDALLERWNWARKQPARDWGEFEYASIQELLGAIIELRPKAEAFDAIEQMIKAKESVSYRMSSIQLIIDRAIQ